MLKLRDLDAVTVLKDLQSVELFFQTTKTASKTKKNRIFWRVLVSAE